MVVIRLCSPLFNAPQISHHLNRKTILREIQGSNLDHELNSRDQVGVRDAIVSVRLSVDQETWVIPLVSGSYMLALSRQLYRIRTGSRRESTEDELPSVH
jgi:hypothetical protein